MLGTRLKASIVVLGLVFVTAACGGAEAPTTPSTPGESRAGTPESTPGEPAALEDITVSLSACSVSDFPVQLADAAGFFEDRGLAAEVVLTGAGATSMAAVMSEAADFAMTGYADAITAVAADQPAITVAALTNEFTAGVVLNGEKAEELGITPGMPLEESIERARGINIAVVALGAAGFKLIQYVFDKYGYDAESDFTVTAIQTGGMVPALQAGLIDAFVHSPPVTDQGLDQGGVVWFWARDIPELVPFVYTGLVTNPKMIDERPQTVQAVVNAIDDALQLLRNDPDEAIRLLVDYCPQSAPEAIAAALQDTVTLYPESPLISQEAFDIVMDFLEVTSGEALDVTLEQANDNTFAEAIDRQ